MSHPAIEIRPCREADIEQVLAFWDRAAAAHTLPDRAEALRRRLTRDPELFMLAWDGPKLVGTLMGGWDGWRANMYRLAVDPAFRRRGIARALVQAVEERLRRLGAQRITCLVFRDEAPAQSFWLSVGYDPDPSIDRFAKNLV